MNRLPRLRSSCLLVLFAAVMPLTAAVRAEWKEVKVPEVWKDPPAGVGGYSWYRCIVEVPSNWKGRTLEIFVEPIDDAREIYVNGELTGTIGSFPPQFRSGLGDRDRFAIEGESLKFGEKNLVAIRVYNSDGRGGFNVAAPVLFGGDDAIRLEGTWQFQAGDDRQWREWSDEQPPAESLAHGKIMPRADAERILRQLPGEEGPLPPEATVKRLKTPDDLKVEVALSEPHIGQPLFMSFDGRGRMWVMNYLQYPNPAGLTMVSRDKFLRSVYDKVPPPPPNHFRGADKVTIHEDTDQDGVFDKHKTFVDGLNLATSFAPGQGGVWVLNPPYLLFYPDRNQDDVPDGDPEVHLEGFGLEDSHSIANNLRFGPDGWLYGAQGSTVTGNIRRYGSQDKPIHSMGQLIWRYHPEQRRYEIYAEGGGNAFGLEIDAKGRIFSGHNGGDTRGFHYLQGAYYQKGFGKHGDLSNPYSYGYFPHIEHHSVPRFTHAFVIYEGATLPANYAGKLFGVGPLQGHVVLSEVEPRGATFKTRDIGYAFTSSDPWCRPVAIAAGPDGGIYVADMYEQRIDHASHYQGRVDKSSGRIYRISGREGSDWSGFDYSKRPALELIELLRHPNRWHREMAQRLLADRRDARVLDPLRELLAASDGQLALEALWALNNSGGFDEDTAQAWLNHSDPHVRAWVIRLLCDDNQVSPSNAASLVQLAATEPNIEVRCQLACSARRLQASDALAIVRPLLKRDEDASDAWMPLLLWWAIEAKAGADRDAVVRLFSESELWQRPLVEQHLLERLMRRFAQAGTQQDLIACARLLEAATSKDQVAKLMKGFETAYAGRELTGLPPELNAAMAKAGGGSLALRLRRAEPEAVSEALRIVSDEKAEKAARIRYLQIFGQISQPECIPVLLQIANGSASDEVRATAVSSLQGYDDPAIAATLISRLSEWPPSVREVAVSVLSSRKAWSLQLVEAVAQQKVSRDAIPVAALHKMLLHPDATLSELIKNHWGEIRDSSSDEMRRQLEQFTEVLAAGSGNPYSGKRLFAENCGKCHILFNAGGQIGPDLTSYKRDDARGLLMHIVNPSLEIREGFENYVIVAADGRTLNGFVTEQDNRIVVLKQADGQTVIIPRDDIEEMTAIRRSIMPEGLLKDYAPQQIRDLFAFLRSTQPLPE